MVKSLTAIQAARNKKISQLYAENYPWMYGWLCKNLNSKSNIEDILQDTFLKLFVSPDVLDKIREPRAYLMVTAKNIIINQARRQKIETEYLKRVAEQQDEEDYSPESIVLVIETLHQVISALAAMEQRPRQAMILHYLHGMTQQQIAEQLNISRSTVQVDLIKAVMYCHRYVQQH